VVVSAVEPVHRDAIGEDAEHEHDDRALMREPEAERETRERQAVLVQPIGEHDPAAERRERPHGEQHGHHAQVVAPVAVPCALDARGARASLRTDVADKNGVRHLFSPAYDCRKRRLTPCFFLYSSTRLRFGKAISNTVTATMIRTNGKEPAKIWPSVTLWSSRLDLIT